MSKPRRRVRPADVIEGKSRPGPRALVTLIAEVNPTGRGLTPSEQTRRYAEKSALQSLLLRWHGDAFFAERTDDEGIVLIRHRHFDECACHAHVSSLDDDARAWVWRHLDDDTSDDARRADERRPRDPLTPSTPGTAADLLAEAQAALTAYDYERAEQLLVRAFELSAGETTASRAMLELLVDVLGQDTRALALEPRLSADARADPPVCALIGLAAARTGDAARALAIAGDLTHPRAGEVCAEAGRAALRAGDLEQARACAARARALGAAPEAASLEVALEASLRTRAIEEEARLDALVTAGDAALAEALARELLAAGLPSASAKRVLREAAARRADAAESELSVQARAALDAGDWMAARRALDELARLGRRNTELEGSLLEAQREAAAARDEKLVSEVLDALARSTEEGLARYLGLSDPLRARVRESGPAALCERAELVRDALKTRRVDHVVAAVQRIGELERALESGDSEAMLAAKEALPRGLDGVPVVRDLVARALAMLAEQRTHEVDAHIPLAFEAMLTMDWDGVSRHLSAVAPASLALVPAAQQAAAAMKRTMAHARENEARVARAREHGADLAALHAGRTAARTLSALMQELASEPLSEHTQQALERARGWAEQADELTGALSAALRFEEHAVPEGTLVNLEDERGLGARAPDVRIDLDGRIWFIASPEERCYLTEATLPELAVTRRFSFSAGHLRRGQDVMPIGDQLWVPLSDGGMLVLDRLSPGTVIDVWWGPGMDKGTHGDDAWTAIAPDGSAVVVPHITPRKHELALRGLTAVTTRTLHHCAAVSFFGRPGRMRALVTGGRRRSWYLVDTSDLTPFGGPERFPGELAELVPIAAIDDPASGSDDPDGGHLFLAVDAPTLDGEPDQAPRYGALYLIRVTADLKPLEHTLVSPECRDLRAWLYLRGPDHILVVHERGSVPSFDLFEAATLQRVGSRRALPGLTVPVQSASGRNVVLLERTHHAFRTVSGPTSLEDAFDAVITVPFLSGRFSPRSSCARVPDAWDRRLYADQLDTSLLKAVTARGDRARLVTMAEASGYMRAFSERVLERTTASVLLKLLWSAPGAAGGAWGFVHGAEHAVVLCPEDPEVVTRLEVAVRQYEGPADRGHSLHLLGLAHLAAGRRAEAVAAWRRGAAMKGHGCPFHFLIAIAGGLTERERDEELNAIPSAPFMTDHAIRYEDAVRAMARLDAALEEGRGADGWQEARRVRDLVGPSWQLSARVAELHLEHPDPATDPWRYQLDLAWMASRAWLGPTRNHMIFAGCHWDHHRFTEIAERAGAALDAMGVGPAERVKEPEDEPPLAKPPG